MDTPLLSVIVPVFNEVGTVRTLLERVRAVPISKQVIVVDDCSTDGTRIVLEELRRESLASGSEGLVVLLHGENKGKGAAVRTGLTAVAGQIVIIQDADLEYDPTEYPRLIAPILEGHADVVYGSRFVGSPRRVLMFWHMVGNKLLTLMSNMCTNLNLTDMETCYKVFRADILKGLPIRSNRFGLEPELTAKVAHLRCRVYEIPIAYHGRDYSEGKKIGVADAFSALWTILRFRMFADIGREDAGFTTLRRIQVLRRYTSFMWGLMQPFVGRRILEVGSGTGSMTRHLASRERIVATDIDDEYLGMLGRSYAGHPNVEVRRLDLASLSEAGFGPGGFDTIVCSNVLEHMEDDVEVLRSMHAILEDGGRVILVVPAHAALYGAIDRAIGHYRRYSRREITDKLEAAGLDAEHVSFFNVPGVLGWFLNAVILRRKSVPGVQARINDALVPWLRIEKRLGLPFGMSILAVGRRRREASMPRVDAAVGEQPLSATLDL